MSLGIIAAAILAVTFAYIALRWRKSPKVFRAMNIVAAASIVAGALTGIWLVGLVHGWLPYHDRSGGSPSGGADGHPSSGAAATPAVSPHRARSKLDSMGIPYRDEEFVEVASNGNAEVVSLFLEAGMKENLAACRQALIGATEHADVITALIRGCDNLSRDDLTQALVAAARSSGHSQTVAALLGAGADANATISSAGTGQGRPVLWAAVNQADDPDTVRALIQGGATVKGTNLLSDCRNTVQFSFGLLPGMPGCRNEDVQHILRDAGAR